MPISASASRAIAAYGLLAGAVPALAVLLDVLPLHVHGFRLVIISQAVWWLAAAAQLIRRRL